MNTSGVQLKHTSDNAHACGLDRSIEPLADQSAYFAGAYSIIELPAASQLSNRKHWQDAP
jgi:hypothetical protein